MAKLFTGVPPQHGSNDRCSLGNNQPSLKRSLFSEKAGWEYLLDWLSYKFPSIRPILKPPALKLIQNGRL